MDAGASEGHEHAHNPCALGFLLVGRAFAQLAAQGHAKVQTLSLTDLLTEFLNANQAAIENSNKVGWEFDRDLCDGMSDRIKRNVEVHIRSEMLTPPSENKKDRLWKKLNPKATSSGSQREAKTDNKVTGKGTTKKQWVTPRNFIQPQPKADMPKGAYGGGKGGGKQGTQGGGKGGGKGAGKQPGKYTKVKSEATNSGRK